MKSDYAKLKESYQELEALKDKLADQELTWKLNLTDAQKVTNNTKAEVGLYNSEAFILCKMRIFVTMFIRLFFIKTFIHAFITDSLTTFTIVC